MKPKWPTIEGRLNQSLTSEIQALKQLKQSGVPLSEYGEKLLKKLEKDVDETKKSDRMYTVR
jgi:urocanate hydratase